MLIEKGIDISGYRKVITPDGIFLSFIPCFRDGDVGDLIMVEKKTAKLVKTGKPVMLKEKPNGEHDKYFVVRKPKEGEDKYRMFSISSYQSYDMHHNYFRIINIVNGIIMLDIKDLYHVDREVIIALKDDGYALITGNHGIGKYDSNLRPNFLIKLKGDGSQEEITNFDVE